MAQRNRLDLIKTYTSTCEYLMPFIKVSSLDQRQRFNIMIEAERKYITMINFRETSVSSYAALGDLTEKKLCRTVYTGTACRRYVSFYVA